MFLYRLAIAVTYLEFKKNGEQESGGLATEAEVFL